jgi:hypothetical protein
MAKTAIKVFISYAHKDAAFFEAFKEGVKSHLSSSDKFDFTAWEDSNLPLGSNWDDEIQKNLAGAGVAILCVSANFLNSRYIRSDEFEALINKYPKTLIIPVYFNHCNIKAWNDLAIRQFFKPGGERYGEGTQADFAFCDLLDFNKENGALVPSAKIALYFEDFVRKIEESLMGISEPLPVISDSKLTDTFKEPDIKAKPVKEKKITDKIVEGAIIVAIVLSLGFIIYTLVFNPADTIESKKFNSTMGCTMFFGSFASFIFNRKFQH